MTFVTFYADFKKRDRGGMDPRRMIELLFRSASLHHPRCKKVVLSDLGTDLSTLSADTEVHRYAVDPSKTMLSRMEAEIEYVKSHDFESDIALLDSDILVNSNLETLPAEDFDVAVTYRQKEDVHHMKKGPLTINGGVLVLKKGHKNGVLSFLGRVYGVFKNQYDDEDLWWWGEQLALRDVIGQANVPEEGVRVAEIEGVRVLLLPCDSYNFSPRPESRSILKELKDKKILHFKGRRKHLAPVYWDLYLNRRERPGIGTTLKSAWRRAGLNARLVVEKLNFKTRFSRAADFASKKIARPFRRNRKKLLGPLAHLRNDGILRNLIRGRRVLIVGSGPSAAELLGIPDGVTIFTCNAGLKLFTDQHFPGEIDLFFLIRSKLRKTITVDGAEVRKMRFIEELVQKTKIGTLVTNHADYVKNTPAFQGRYQKLLYDNASDVHYLEHLIRPLKARDIAGSSPCPWTSTGLRLLQYALYFQPKEIYLIGIDLGRNGYFWGANSNEWRHADIDENFLRIVGERYPHVYSLSPKSPASKYLAHQKGPFRLRP